MNHYEAHHLITEKYHLLDVMLKYCDSIKENVFDLTPITFYVEISDPNNQQVYN